MVAALTLGATACERDGDDSAADEVVIVTPSGAPGSATGDTGEGPVITLPAVSPGPLPDTDDEFCAAVISAVTDYNAAISAYTGEILNASAAGALSNDMTGINGLGAVVNDLAIDARSRMEAALALTDDKPATDGLNGMIGYIDAYLTPIALIMVAATDFDAFNTDIVTLTQSQLTLINQQTGHAASVESHTEERCGVKIDVLTAG
jgi:hypothetical protein